MLKKETEEYLTVSEGDLRASRLQRRAFEERNSNRRRGRRVLINEIAQWDVDEIRREGVVRDISRWGMMLQCTVPIPRHSQIKIFIPLTVRDNRVLCFLEGLVVWSNQRLIGVEFTNIPTESCNQLISFLERRSR